jgi:hypothetical protein
MFIRNHTKEKCLRRCGVCRKEEEEEEELIVAIENNFSHLLPPPAPFTASGNTFPPH